MPETWLIAQLERDELEGMIDYTGRIVVGVSDANMTETLEDTKQEAVASKANLKDVNFDLVSEPGPFSSSSYTVVTPFGVTPAPRLAGSGGGPR